VSKESEAKRRAALTSGVPRLSSIWLIYAREMRDQLRDRRTLFTIAVLPILLYPLVGMLLLQIAQFTRQQPTSLCVVGSDRLQNAPALFGENAFDASLDEDFKSSVSRWKVTTLASSEFESLGNVDETVSQWVRGGVYDVAMVIPENFSQADRGSIDLIYNVGSDQSMVARDRVQGILERWRSGWVRQQLDKIGVNVGLLEPFKVNSIDIAPQQTRQAAFWSKLLPFVMLIWAMTGAFYPAIDLVAGEKERGTLETILCSPALRSEIVWGKLAAVTTFSIATAVLNASSMLVTSSFVFKQIGLSGDMSGPPPIAPMLWLLVALIPLASLFSALALAVAAMARSSKEGQYYLMPLMMVTLPLVLLPMLPGTTLTIGTAVIPVTGMFLLVRSLVEAQYVTALFHLPIVLAVTVTCLHLAVRWAQRQFENESVLFGGGDQWELKNWVRHLWRDRQTAATPEQAFACGAIILVGLFFGKLAVTEMPTTIAGFAKIIIAPQIGLILAPAILMATMLTTSLRKSLRLRMPHWTTLPLAAVLGFVLHPSYMLLAEFIRHLYPISEEAQMAMKPFTDQISAAPWGTILFMMAIVPAICEELAFRGFIFAGLARNQGRWRAVLVTAVMFGISHGILQQSISASIMGVLLGWIAMRTGSVLPGMIVHFTSNALSVSLERINDSGWAGVPVFLTGTGSDLHYQPLWIAISIPITIAIGFYFATLRSTGFDDEADRIDTLPTIADPGTKLLAI
jgi:sodium transport system permease protein